MKMRNESQKKRNVNENIKEKKKNMEWIEIKFSIKLFKIFRCKQNEMHNTLSKFVIIVVQIQRVNEERQKKNERKKKK